jgi:hypothetical protein|tara:strand:- start:2383 stop:2604 length:222 start_codon:yes stop_codon:yes gene_type:complete
MNDVNNELMFAIGIYMVFLLVVFVLFSTISISINDFEKKLDSFALKLTERYDMESKIKRQYSSPMTPQEETDA